MGARPTTHNLSILKILSTKIFYCIPISLFVDVVFVKECRKEKKCFKKVGYKENISFYLIWLYSCSEVWFCSVCTREEGYHKQMKIIVYIIMYENSKINNIWVRDENIRHNLIRHTYNRIGIKVFNIVYTNRLMNWKISIYVMRHLFLTFGVLFIIRFLW